MSSSSSSSLRQHQRRSLTVSSGYSSSARNHNVSKPTPHHSSSMSFTTQRPYGPFPSSKETTAITTTTTTTTVNTLHEDNNKQLNENANSIFNLQHKITNFQNSSINEKFNETTVPRSTHHLCGSIIPLPSSTSSSSSNINHCSTENNHLNLRSFIPLSFKMCDIKYRSNFFIFSRNVIEK